MRLSFGRSQPPQPPKGTDMHTGTSLAEAQAALKRAQADHAKVIGMRPKTDENAEKAKRLLVENHLARRIRESYQ